MQGIDSRTVARGNRAGCFKEQNGDRERGDTGPDIGELEEPRHDASVRTPTTFRRLLQVVSFRGSSV